MTDTLFDLTAVPARQAINLHDPVAFIVQTEEEIEDAYTFLRSCTHIAIDTETLWTDSFTNKLLMGFSVFSLKEQAGEAEKRAYYFPYRHDTSALLFKTHNIDKSSLRQLQLLFDNPGITWIYHNAKFDMQVFEHEGLRPSSNFYDTMLMSHMVNENYFSHALKWLAVQIIGPDADSEAKMIKKVRKSIPWEQIPIEVMGKYACKDAELTFYLYQYFEPKLRQQELDHLWKKEAEFSMLLGKIETLGIGIDIEVAQQFADQASQRMQSILAQLGYDPAKPSQLAHRLYGAVDSGGLGLVPESFSKRPSTEFPSGIPNMARATLSRLKHPEVSLVLEYRSLQKALSTWFLGFKEKAEWDEETSSYRLHPTYKQHGTVTTRLSCSNPNMQQLPRRKEDEVEEGITNAAVKKMLRPANGYEIWEFDVSQAEFRLAALYGKEEEILAAYRQGDKDFHQITADKLGIPRVAYDGTKREGKTLNFSMLYGAGPGKLAEMLECPASEAAQLHAEFWQQYPSLRDQVAMATMAAQARGWVRLWTGRRRHFQNQSETHKAFNSLIQGGVAEIIKESMLRVDRELPIHTSLRSRPVRMIAQVHDSLWFEIPEESVEDLAAAIKEVMEWPSKEFNLPFPVDMKRLA